MRIKYLLASLLFFTAIFSLAGCNFADNEESVYFKKGPAIGLQVEDKTITDVKLQDQSRLGIEAADGAIRLSYWDNDYLEVTVRKKIKGPASKDKLKSLLDNISFKVENLAYEIKLKVEISEDIKPLFRGIADIELKVPGKLKIINIRSGTGKITMTGFEELNSADFRLDKGNIEISGCKANDIYVKASEGDIELNGIECSGEYECGRGNIRLRDIKGNIRLKLTAGEGLIEGAEGKLDCDISAGRLIIKDSKLMADTVLYASTGNIEADLSKIEPSGKYTIKSASGSIYLNLPENAGWSIIAESTKGRVKNNTGLDENVLKKSPSGEIYGDFGGGGPMIDAYTDRGNIILDIT